MLSCLSRYVQFGQDMKNRNGWGPWSVEIEQLLKCSAWCPALWKLVIRPWQGYTAYMQALANGHAECTERLTREGASQASPLGSNVSLLPGLSNLKITTTRYSDLFRSSCQEALNEESDGLGPVLSIHTFATAE